MKTLGEVKINNKDSVERIAKRVTEHASHEMSFKIDTYISLHIKPKPVWLPEFIYKYLLKNLLILEQFKK